MTGAAWPDSEFYASSHAVTAGNYVANGPWYVDFMFDGDAFEIYTKGVGAKYRIMVDGAWADETPYTDSVASGARHLIKVAFGSRANRHVRIEMRHDFRFGGIYAAPTDTVWKPSTPTGPKVAVLGDSYVFGSGTDSAYVNGFVTELGYLMGWPNVRASGLGSTGYLETSGGATFRGRVDTDVIDWAPDIVIVFGSVNDDGETSSAMQAEAELLYADIVAGLPDATLIVVGPPWPRTPTASIQTVRDGIEAAATTANGVDLFVDAVDSSDPWFTGSGRVGATAGDGNADYYTSTDSTHPSVAGHKYLARRIAAGIAAGL